MESCQTVFGLPLFLAEPDVQHRNLMNGNGNFAVPSARPHRFQSPGGGIAAPPIGVKNKPPSGPGDGLAGMDKGPGIWHFMANKFRKSFCISKKPQIK
ncbi:MAG: hypothetical protein IIC52_08435 [Proteobacteria bacterium]|nr:hypothetical protein [Pseudomonadota bacterium]